VSELLIVNPWDKSEQERVQRAAIGCDVGKIAEEAGFSDWPGYLGILLRYTAEVAGENKLLTGGLVPQLRRYVRRESAAARLFEEISRSGEPIRWPDLEIIEGSFDPRLRDRR
jgi:hypothetical protein